MDRPIRAGFIVENLDGPRANLQRRRVGMLRQHTQRATVGRQLDDVVNPESRDAASSARHRQSAKVGEVLVVNRVELVAVDQAQQVRKLDGTMPPGAEQAFQSRHEIVEVGHVGEHVVGDDQVGTRPLLLPGRCRVTAKEPR